MSRKRPRNNGGTVASIHRRDKGKCWICRQGVNATDASRDHIEVRVAGGYDKARNYRLAHRSCNSARSELPESITLEVVRAIPLLTERKAVAALRVRVGEYRRSQQRSVR